MDSEILKKRVAYRAIEFVKFGSILGVGSGTTVNYFIDYLAKIKNRIEVAVSSSQLSTDRLKNIGVEVIDANSVDEISLYIDSADKIDDKLHMLKGGGGALLGEKIIASISKLFICIVDKSKYVRDLSDYPFTVEVIPMARSYVARELVKMGGKPIYREKMITDYKNILLDVHNMRYQSLARLEKDINNICGVVENGIFYKNSANILLLSNNQGVDVISR